MGSRPSSITPLAFRATGSCFFVVMESRELLETRALAQRACGSMRASVTLARERLDVLQSAMQAKVAELEATGSMTRAALQAETARRKRAELDFAELMLELTAAQQGMHERQQTAEAERSGVASREEAELNAARFAQAKQLLGELQRRHTQQSSTLARQQDAALRAREKHAAQQQQQAALRAAVARLEAQASTISKLQAAPHLCPPSTDPRRVGRVRWGVMA